MVVVVLIAAAAGVASTLVWRSPTADVGVLEARIVALQAKVDSMARALDSARESRVTDSSPATRISDPVDEKVAGDPVSALAKRLDEIAHRLDVLSTAVDSAGSSSDGITPWKSKDPRVVDTVARSSRDSPETAVARFFMMTTRQVYELMGLPDHRSFEGEAGEVCAWHYKTGIDGSCLVITFHTNMATRVDTLPCTMEDGELEEWIKEWVRRK